MRFLVPRPSSLFLALDRCPVVPVDVAAQHQHLAVEARADGNRDALVGPGVGKIGAGDLYRARTVVCAAEVVAPRPVGTVGIERGCVAFFADRPVPPAPRPPVQSRRKRTFRRSSTTELSVRRVGRMINTPIIAGRWLKCGRVRPNHRSYEQLANPCPREEEPGKRLCYCCLRCRWRFLSRRNSTIFQISSGVSCSPNGAMTVPRRPLTIVLKIIESVGL